MKEPNTKIKVLIVDDSPFSRQVITDALDPDWFEVVGFADGFRSALEGYRTLMPDVVTMDIVMPEIDGLEATRRIISEESDAKIIILSSMKDDDLAAQAKAKGAVNFLQKPFAPQELMSVLKAACESGAPEELFTDRYPEVFLETLVHLLSRFVPDITVQPVADEPDRLIDGIVVLVGITGQFRGQVRMNLSLATAEVLAARLLKQDPNNDDQVNDVIAELTNMVAGNAVSKLNREFRGVFLRVSPAIVFTGDKFSVTSPNLASNRWRIDTPFGQANFRVGFKKEVN